MKKSSNNKIPVTIRLYKIHDLDILTFVETHKLDLRIALYCTLKAFSNKEYFIIDIPPLREGVDKMEFQQYKKMYSILIWLDKNNDAEVVEMLMKIQSGYRNNFIKTLLRLYLCNPMSEMFLERQDDKTYFEERFMMFKQGKKIVDAGSEVKDRKGGRIKLGGMEKKEKDELTKNENIENKRINIESEKEIVNNIQKEEIVHQELEENKVKEIIDNVESKENENVGNDNDEDIADLFSSIIG